MSTVKYELQTTAVPMSDVGLYLQSPRSRGIRIDKNVQETGIQLLNVNVAFAMTGDLLDSTHFQWQGRSRFVLKEHPLGCLESPIAQELRGTRPSVSRLNTDKEATTSVVSLQWKLFTPVYNVKEHSGQFTATGSIELSPIWLQTLKWIRKLNALRDIEDGWDGYSAPGPSSRALDNADRFLKCVLKSRVIPSKLSPSVVGGVGITFKTLSRKAYVEFSNKGSVHCLFSDGRTEPHVSKTDPSLDGYERLITDIENYVYE